MTTAFSNWARSMIGLPPLDRAANDRGVAHYHRGEYQQAIAAFDEALEHNPRTNPCGATVLLRQPPSH